MKLFGSRDEKEAADNARVQYERFLAVLRDGATVEQVRAEVTALQASGASSALSARQRHKLGDRAFHAYADAVLADEVLTQEEEDVLMEVGEAVGLEDDNWANDRDLLYRLSIAKANDGRLSTLEDPNVLTKKNEVVHLEMLAGLMKEVTLREFRGGSSGFSFRIAKGVRYRTGAFRGHSVVVGTQLQVADTGPLAVTSTRVVFLGSRKTIEVPYPKLLGVEVFSDGIRFSASNRQNAPLFRVENGDVVAATVNAAVQRFNK
jgi:hypothetical protein